MSGKYIEFTPDELTQARNIDLLAYVQSRGYNIIRRGNHHYVQMGDSDSLHINTQRNLWNWFSHGIGGDAIKFLTDIEKIPFPEAVSILLGREIEHTSDRPPPIIRQIEPIEVKRHPLMLPPKASDQSDAFLYLAGRGIHVGILQTLIAKGQIYQADQFWFYSENQDKFELRDGKQVVFLGYDHQGNTMSGAARSIHGSYKGDCYGSNKRYTFALPYAGSNKLYLSESAIEVLSYMTIQHLEGTYEPAHRLSLDGFSYSALEQYLSDHPDIKEIYCGFNNDQRGHDGTRWVIEHYAENYRIHDTSPKQTKDHNDQLKIMRRQRNPHQRTHPIAR